ncbi:hypothetical protein [Aureimonas phyllosphaerae]|uniref:Uncharacterized protein n=1 Tax=Aureimonas phyllosphaerae TaxID=1166078 RepID=A0A7W6FVZ3_9HYPH|nr:hypothetical protein [Aureimonas phyllosphaerae]MBB3937350.1 hypothetical protein [Aureimonas phyllosphaerae]MBB3961357.1 hypothetical protein [Aureimonas phyllosphaerae]SFF42208.1 hypothetical protein SAMN05216566_11270 [Aureimonas phyllosphaerae]
MSTETSRFRQIVKKLKPPSSAAFEASDWQEAFTAGPVTDEDSRLYDAAIWLGQEGAAASSLQHPEIAKLSPEWGAVLAVAALNREFRTASELGRKTLSEAIKSGVRSLDATANQRIRGLANQNFTVADIAEVGVDLTENWLYDAAQSTGAEGENIADLAPMAVAATMFYSFRKSLNTLWNRAWIEGWHLRDEQARGICWIPRDFDRERLVYAWRVRQEANFMNYPSIDRAAWMRIDPERRRTLARTFSVTEIEGYGKKLKLKVRAISYRSKHMPSYMYDKGMLEGSYVADFIKTPMPLHSDLNVGLLQEAWHVILDIARLLSKRVALPTSLSPTQARRLALAVEASTLVEAISSSLRIDRVTAERVVAFLTFSFQTGGTRKAKGNKGLWAAPLVAVPETDELLLALPALVTSNPVRRAEAWLEKGGISDNASTARGDRYEVLFRDRIRKALESNKAFANPRHAPDGIAKSNRFDEQVDLVLSFGGLCLVCEVKFFLMPADPHERERFDKKLLDAASQASRKAGKLERRRDVLADALGIVEADAAELDVMPLVVTNQGYGFSERVDGVLVVEAEFLRTYLSGGSLSIGMVSDSMGRSVTQSTTLYRTEREAAKNFDERMSSPYTLRRFLNRITWTVSELPTLVSGATRIATPQTEDLQGIERLQSEILISQLSR